MSCIADAAPAADGLPGQAPGWTRPNRDKSATFSLRLNPNELADLQYLAREQGVPASALVRSWILKWLAAERDAPTGTAAMVDRLEADVRTLRKLVAS